MTQGITFIIPVLDDLRVIKCIESIRRFDDTDNCVILLMAGKSSDEFGVEVVKHLKPRDSLNRTPDNGLFDALNKGLELAATPLIGWLGADDFLSKNLLASSVMSEFTGAVDAVVYSTAYYQGDTVTRVLDSRFAKKPYLNWGFHNPHFSTFLTKELSNSASFKIHAVSKNQFADITYFSEVLSKANITTKPIVAVYMSEGGVGSGSFKSVLVNFRGRYNLFKTQYSAPRAALMVMINYCWKVSSKFSNRVAGKKVEF